MIAAPWVLALWITRKSFSAAMPPRWIMKSVLVEAPLRALLRWMPPLPHASVLSSTFWSLAIVRAPPTATGPPKVVAAVTVRPWLTETFELNVALGTQVSELPTVRLVTVIAFTVAVPEVVSDEHVTPAAVVAPDTLSVPPRVVAALTLSGWAKVAAPVPAAKVRAVASALLLDCPLGATCRASVLLPLPESVSSQRQQGSGEAEFGVKVLQSMATVAPPLPGPYTFTPVCPLAVVVICRPLLAIAPSVVVPETLRALAETAPDAVRVVHATAVAVVAPDTLSAPASVAAPATSSVLARAVSPEIAALPFTSRYARGVCLLIPTNPV